MTSATHSDRSSTPVLFAQKKRILDRTNLIRVSGRVIEMTGLTIIAEGLPLSLGSICEIKPAHRKPVLAEVVGFRGKRSILMSLSDPIGVGPKDVVTSMPAMETVGVGQQLLGRVLNGLGQPIDGAGACNIEQHIPIYTSAPEAFVRRHIDEPMTTGIRSMDAMLTLGRGQRIGLFAGTGVGKSVLMGMISRYTDADVTVIALVGERGREVGDFIKKDLGEEGIKRTVMVVSTSDESPVLRVRACFVATAVAEYFRSLGKNVLLLMDSVTRLAMAQRQIGLAAGEPPATKGYPPSVFAMMPKLMERAGRTDRGSITGIYTVLVEGDDINEPIADAARGVLDGHVWLSRKIANAGHYPAVSVLDSISRVMPDVITSEHLSAARSVRRILATWADIEDLVNIGAYAKGANLEYDLAVEMMPRIRAFLEQGQSQRCDGLATTDSLLEIQNDIESMRLRLSNEAGNPAQQPDASATQNASTPQPADNQGAA